MDLEVISTTKDVEICFNLLVDTFCFSIRLRVIGSEEGEVVSKGFS